MYSSHFSFTKKIVIMFVLYSTMHLSHVSIAQKFTLGVKGGASLTWPGFGDREAKEVFNRRLKPGYQASLLLGFPLKHRYDLMLEGGLSQRGRILTFNDDHSWKNNLTMQMTDMSMMLRRSFTFMLRKNTPSEAFFCIGPEINYWFRSRGYLQVLDGRKYEYRVLFNKEEAENNTEYLVTMRDVNQWLFALDVGCGVKAPLKKNRHLTAELRFSSGHTFLGKPNSATLNRIILDMQDTMKTNLKSLTFSLAYTIDVDMKERRKGKSTIKKKLRQ
jgi:hypothetical protein